MTNSAANNDKQKKGHLKVNKDGVASYKKIASTEIKKSLQYGIVYYLHKNLNEKMDRDLLYQDFQVIDSIYMRDQQMGSFSIMPSLMNNLTNNDFYFTVYAPYVFKFLRYKYNLNEREFMVGLFSFFLI
jgi:hypothetical protein